METGLVTSALRNTDIVEQAEWLALLNGYICTPPVLGSATYFEQWTGA